MTDDQFLKHVQSITGILFRLSLSILNNKEDAEDAVAEVVSKMWERRHTLPGKTNVEGYMVITTRNYCLDRIKLRKRKFVHLDAGVPDREMDAETNWVNSENTREIQRIIASLPEKQQIILHLRMVESMSIENIAVWMNEEKNTIEVNLFRARKKIKEEYGRSR